MRSSEENAPPKPKARFEARQARLERETPALRRQSAAVQPAAKDQDAIAAALARGKETGAGHAQPVVIQAGSLPNNSAVIAAVKRVKRKRALNSPLIRWLTARYPATIRVNCSGGGHRPRQITHASRNSRPEANLPAARSTRAKPRWKRLSPAPKPQAGAAGRRRTWTVDPRKAALEAYRPRQAVSRSGRRANLPNRSIRVKPRWKRLSPAPEPVSRSSRPEANLPNRPTT